MKTYWNLCLVLTLCLSCLTARTRAQDADKLSFFTVADTHVGWINKMQPSLVQQQDALRTVLSAFPGIDFLMDAGDNTYPDEDLSTLEAMRKNWMSIEPNACVGIPFLYAAGNHEVMHWKEADPETQCAVLGSTPCRPYYSITCKGIHIISLPELTAVVFLTGELLDWLQLDLAAHKDLTTIIVSHNSILNTTGNDTPGYRGLAQSEQLLELFQRNPQVIAWMHGHNHDYAVVERSGMLFVSVGRFGGFSHNVIPLGGIYVEINPSGIVARGYNAETGQFLEGTNGNRNHLPVSGSLSRRTSFDANAKAEICFGIGRDQNGSKIPVFNHFAGGTATAYIVPEKNVALNDNPDFSLYAERTSAKGVDRQLFGYGFRVSGKSGFKVAPGSLSLELNGYGGLLVSPDLRRSSGYYHAVPGKPYCATVEITAPAAGGTLELCLLAGSTKAAAAPSNSIAVQRFPLKSGRGTYSLKGIMKSSEKTIYPDPESDVLPTIVAQATIMGLSSATAHSFVLSRADAAASDAPALTIGETAFAAKSASDGLWSAELGSSMRCARTVVETLTGGCSSWLISKRDIDWQVRNAAVTDNGKSLSEESIRNPWSDEEVLIAPLFKTAEPFLAKTRGIRSMEVFPINRGNNTLRITVAQTSQNAFLLIKSPTGPKSVSGVVSWE